MGIINRWKIFPGFDFEASGEYWKQILPCSKVEPPVAIGSNNMSE